MKVTIEFDGEEEREELQNALDGAMSKVIIEDIWSNCFRPNNKHGYNDELLDSKEAYDIIEKLATIYLNTIGES